MIYIMRHGKAVDRSDSGDMGRWLTTEGRNDVRSIGRALVDKNVTVDKVVCSPYVRASQSAELMAKELGMDGPIITMGDVTPDGDVEVARALLLELGGNVLLLSHESFVSRFVKTMTGFDKYFSTSEVRCIDARTLKWSLNPKDLVFA